MNAYFPKLFLLILISFMILVNISFAQVSVTIDGTVIDYEMDDWNISGTGSYSASIIGTKFHLSAGSSYGVVEINKMFNLSSPANTISMKIDDFTHSGTGHAEIRITLYNGASKVAQYYQHLGENNGPYHPDEQTSLDYYTINTSPNGSYTVSFDFEANRPFGVTNDELNTVDKIKILFQADTWGGGSTVDYRIGDFNITTGEIGGGEEPVITIISPQAGDHWQMGADNKIAWDNFGGPISSIEIYLSTAGTTIDTEARDNYQLLVTLYDNENYWLFNSNNYPDILESINCRLKIIAYGPGGSSEYTTRETSENQFKTFSLTEIADIYPKTLFEGHPKIEMINVLFGFQGEYLYPNIKVFGSENISNEGLLDIAIHIDTDKWHYESPYAWETEYAINLIVNDEKASLSAAPIQELYVLGDPLFQSGWQTTQPLSGIWELSKPWTKLVFREFLGMALKNIAEYAGDSRLGHAANISVPFAEAVYELDYNQSELSESQQWAIYEQENFFDVYEIPELSSLSGEPDYPNYSAKRHFIQLKLDEPNTTLDVYFRKLWFRLPFAYEAELSTDFTPEYLINMDIGNFYLNDVSPSFNPTQAPEFIENLSQKTYYFEPWKIDVSDGAGTSWKKEIYVKIDGPVAVENNSPFNLIVTVSLPEPNTLDWWKITKNELSLTIPDNNAVLYSNPKQDIFKLGNQPGRWYRDEDGETTTSDYWTASNIWANLIFKFLLNLTGYIGKTINLGYGINDAIIETQEIYEISKDDQETIYSDQAMFDVIEIPDKNVAPDSPLGSRRKISKTYIPLKMNNTDATVDIVFNKIKLYRPISTSATGEINEELVISLNPMICSQNPNSITVTAYCPVTIEIHQGGMVTGQNESQIPNSEYLESDFNLDGSIDSRIVLYNPDNDIFNVLVNPINELNDDSVFTLIRYSNSETIIMVNKANIAHIPPEGYYFSTLDTGSINGIISAGSARLISVPVDLYDSAGAVVASAVTDDSGYYQFPGLDNGGYSVSISTPLGYQTDEETKEIEVKGLPHEINFDLTQLDITPQQRSRGYWSHQLHKALQDKAKDYTIEDFANLAGLINKHFNQNQINPVDFYSVPQPADQNDSLKVLKRLLHMRRTCDGDPFLKRLANAQLMALMLNVVSGKVGQTHEISTDGRTVSQAITYCDMLVNDEIDPPEDSGPGHGSQWCQYIRASFILIKANLGLTVPSDMIPEDVIQIAYRIHNEEQLPDGFELSQNYPNPFNPVTQINFTLPKATNVQLTIFNIAGQKVEALLDRHIEAGLHTITWDGGKYASGIYFYQIKAGEFTATRKMTLLK